MNIKAIICGCIYFLLLGGVKSYAEEETTEPVELVRLREQFQQKVDQEMKPWRARYAQELQKLEDRLINDRRLSDALTVKKEREANTGLSSVPTERNSPSVAGSPKTAAELQKYLVDTVWMVYAADDKKSENLIAVYHFYDSDNLAIVSTKLEKTKWICKSNKDILIPYTSGDIALSFEVIKSTATAEHIGKKFTAIFVGRPNKNK